VPWSGEHGGDDADDDALADLEPPRSPPPPDDRLWRHPSELSWPAGAPAASVTPVAPTPATPATPTGGRMWTVALASGLTGAVLTLGLVATIGGLGRVTERVVERVPVSNPLLATGAKSQPPSVPGIANAVSPSVVRLDVETDIGTVTGSGVVLRDDGTILTNAHVVGGSLGITIVRSDGTGVPGTIVGVDPLTDVAVVAPGAEHRGIGSWTPAVIGSSADLEVGEPAIAIGSPLGLAGGPSVTVGVVSGLGRRVDAEGVVLHGMIQTDAPIARGSSGGALCDGSGVVVGITTAIAGDDRPDGLGFAIPVEVARAVADELLGEGDVDHAWLGIEGHDLAPTESSMPGLATGGGIRVVELEADGPAAAAGVEPGDVVVGLGGQRVRSMSELVAALRRHEPGATVIVELRRGEQALTVAVALGERD
jgi:S1-C subfamily serine protease